MKKYLSLLLALCLTLSLAACGGKTDSSADAAGDTQTGVVTLAVRLAYTFTLIAWFPSMLSQPLSASATL